MIRHQLRHVDHEDGFGPDPRLVIEVVGLDDVYRIARVLETAQIEFSALATSVLRGLDRRQPGVVRAMVARMGPTGPHRYVGRSPRRSK